MAFVFSAVEVGFSSMKSLNGDVFYQVSFATTPGHKAISGEL